MTGTHKTLGISLRVIISAITFVVIGFTLAITINPVDFIRFAQDKQRTTDLKNLSQIITAMEVRIPESVLAETNTVYISLPDDDPSCSKWIQKGLPALQKGFSYRCAPENRYRDISGNGWIPINFTLNKNISFSQLPIDPDNGGRGLDPDSGNQIVYFYQYVYGSTAFGTRLVSQQGIGLMIHNFGGYVSEMTWNLLSGEVLDSPLIQAISIAGNQAFFGNPQGIRHIITSQPGLSERIEVITRPIIEFAVSNQLGKVGEELDPKTRQVLTRALINQAIGIFLPPSSDETIIERQRRQDALDREVLLNDPIIPRVIQETFPVALQKIILTDSETSDMQNTDSTTDLSSPEQKSDTKGGQSSSPSQSTTQPPQSPSTPSTPSSGGESQPPAPPSPGGSSSVNNNHQALVPDATIPSSIRSASLGTDSKGKEMKFIPLTEEQIANL